jgi:choline dehydrogenase-like flavoprotein
VHFLLLHYNSRLLGTCANFLDPCGVCHLSSPIEEGVVDSYLKVHGVKNLRVIDASISQSYRTAGSRTVYVVGENLVLGDAHACTNHSCMNYRVLI